MRILRSILLAPRRVFAGAALIAALSVSPGLLTPSPALAQSVPTAADYGWTRPVSTSQPRDTGSSSRASLVPTSLRAEQAFARVQNRLRQSLEAKGLSLGAPVFIRIFKLTRQLEVWSQDVDGRFTLFRTYSICDYSGGMGPKLQEGDNQSPEGFYTVYPENMNPNSKFHLSFNLGFPNAYDRAHGRTGNLIMVHGSCVSRGCFAMTDKRMEEIYALVGAAFEAGQNGIPVHIFPFKMTDVNIDATRSSAYHQFWMNLKEGHDFFEQTRVPPAVWVEGRSYRFARRQPTADQLIAATATLSSGPDQRGAPTNTPVRAARGASDGLPARAATPCGAPQCPLPTVQ